MKKTSLLLSVSMVLTLTACGEAGKQWWDPDVTFASVKQPEIKGVNDTQEEQAKEAALAGDYGRAAQFYGILVSSDKATKEQQLRYKLGLANATRRMGDHERALGMFEELMKDNPANLDAAEGRALTLMSIGKTLEASRGFSEIVEKDATRWRTLNALGILFVTKNMVPEAMVYYNEALKFSPDNPAILNNIGLSQAIDKNYKRAVDVLDQANRMSKNAAQRKQIDLNQAMVYAVSNDLDKAHDLAAKYYDGAALDNNMGLYAHLAKDDGLAKTYLNMALSQSPTYYERAWSNLDALGDSEDDKKKSSDAKVSAEAKPAAEAKLVEAKADEKKSGRSSKSSSRRSAAKRAEPVAAEAKAAKVDEKKPVEEAKPAEKPAEPIAEAKEVKAEVKKPAEAKEPEKPAANAEAKKEEKTAEAAPEKAN